MESRFSELKKKIANSKVISEELRKECEEYIQNVAFSAMSGDNDFYREYCSYAFAMGITYTNLGRSPMCVSINTEDLTRSHSGIYGIKFCIDAVHSIEYFRSEIEILFGIAHEIKHVLNKHLTRYKDLYKENTTGVILNLCNDVEVNESLKSELYKSKRIDLSKLKVIVPSCFDFESMAKILGCGYDEYRLASICKSKEKEDVSNSVSYVLYKIMDKKCKDVLGYSIDNILYHVQVAKTTFNEEIFKTAETGCSTVFKIKDNAEAKRFCYELSLYLTRCRFQLIIVSNGFGSDSADKSGSSISPNDTSSEGNGKGESSSVKKNGSGSGKEGERKSGSYKENNGEPYSDRVDETSLEEIISESLKAVKEVYTKGLKGVKGRGTSHGGGRNKLTSEDFKSTLPWQVMLKSYLTTMLQDKIYTKKRLNRRQPNRLELSGTRYNPSITIILGVDDSGSMSNREIAYIFSEIEAIAKQFNCDIHIYRFTGDIEEYTYIKRNDTKKLSKIRKMSKERYSGGTSFQPVFDAVQKNAKIKLSRAVLVMCTDGGGERNVDFGKVKNRIWIVTRNRKSENVVSISCSESSKNIFPVVPTRL